MLPSFFPFTSCIINVVVGIEYHSTPLICRHLPYDHPSCLNGTRAPDGEKGVCWRELGCSREEFPMDAVTRQADRGGKHDRPDNHSHVVRPAEMEGKKTRFPGCEVKGLLLDRQTGLVTALMRLAPGAVLPDHEHVKIEQTYMLEGKLVDKEGPVAGLGRSR